MGDPAPPHRRTHGGTSAGVLALIKPLPPKAVAGRPGFTRAKRPRLRSPPAHRWAVVRNMRPRQASCRARYITHSKFNRAEKTNHHIKIYCTIRHEAFLKLPEFESDAFQISGRCTKIEYTRDDLEKIFLKNIEITGIEHLVDSDNADAMLRLVGESNKAVEHLFVSKPEPIFDYFLRHTLYRPRDLMFIGGEIVKINPGESSAPASRDAVN